MHQVKAEGTYDPAAKRYTIVLEQSCGPSPGQPTKEPYHIPIRVGLLSRSTGAELCSERVLELREKKQVALLAAFRSLCRSNRVSSMISSLDSIHLPRLDRFPPD